MATVIMATKLNGVVAKKAVYTNMPMADAIKVANRMNRLNILLAKKLGDSVKRFVYFARDI